MPSSMYFLLDTFRRVFKPIRGVVSLVLDLLFFIPAMLMMVIAVLLYALVGVITREENFFNLLDESLHDHRGRENYLQDHALLRHFEMASLVCVAIILFPASLLVFIGRTFEYDNRDPGMTATFGGAILLIGQLPFRIVLYYLIAFGQWIESRGRIHAS